MKSFRFNTPHLVFSPLLVLCFYQIILKNQNHTLIVIVHYFLLFFLPFLFTFYFYLVFLPFFFLSSITIVNHPFLLPLFFISPLSTPSSSPLFFHHHLHCQQKLISLLFSQ